ncbi:MAG: MBL fold metallo-hydrolase [Coriobacteriia bacterium]|nr:MBL fold metallo-hydrolase [Coriobacteriia bacterium]
MDLTILGSSASFPGPGRACAGYLLAAGGTHVVLDLGNGTLSNLSIATDPYALDAVFISHLHADHFLDLFALMAMVRYAPEGTKRPVALFAPEGLEERMGSLMSPSGRSDVAEAFTWTTLRDAEPVEVGAFTLTPYSVEHEGPTFAIRAEAGGRTLCYTSDSRYSDPVRRASTGCDLLLADATLPAGYAGRAPHMTSAEAGALAAEAGASKLVLTHLWPTVPRGDILDDAQAAFTGNVILAEELASVEV